MFKRLKKVFSFFVVLCTLVYCTNAWGVLEERKKHSLAVKAAKSGSLDFAFMNYRALLKDFPKSRYREEAIFAQGEYYFMLPDYKKAAESFNIILEGYPEAEGKIFALAYLLRVAQLDKDEGEKEKIKKAIIAFRRNSFLFEESKDYEYLSPLYQKHKVLFFIDRIEFYVNDKLIAKMAY